MPADNLLKRTRPCMTQMIFRLASVVALTIAVFTPRAIAADNIWTNGAGTFSWNLTSANWTLPSRWNNDAANADAAIFGATGVGTINLAGTINTRSLDFRVDGYALSGGAINLVNTGTGTLGAGTINVGGTSSIPTAITSTINSNLISTVGLIKTGDGTLVLNGYGNSIGGLIPIGQGTGSGYSASVLIGSSTTTAFGGTLRLSSTNSLPATTTVAIGNGILDIGMNNVTLGGLTFANTRPDTAFVTDRQGVIGSGTLTLTGPIRMARREFGSPTVGSNYINVPIDANAGTLRIEGGGLKILKPIANGSLFVYGYNIQLLANNSYTGSTTISGNATIAGTNQSTDLRFVDMNSTLMGAFGSYERATSVSLVGSFLHLDNQTGAGPNPTIPRGTLNNRIGGSAALTLVDSIFELAAGPTASVSQTLGSIDAPAGSSYLQCITPNIQTASIVVSGNLTVGSTASLLIGGGGFPTTAAVSPGPAHIVVNGTLPATVNGIIPGLYGTNIATGGFVRNSSTPGVGLVMLAPSDYSTNAFGATLNVDLTTPQILTTSQAANSLRISANITIEAGNSLTIGEGGILVRQPVTFAGPGTLAFGDYVGRIFAHSDTTISGPISGTAGLSRSGTGSLTLSGDLSGLSGTITNNGSETTLYLNTPNYTGSINVVAGTVDVNVDIGAGGPVTLGTSFTPAGTANQAAVLNIDNVAITDFVRNIATIGGDGNSPFVGGFSGSQLTTLNSAAQIVSGNISLGTHLTINASGTATTTLSGQITGPGGLHILGGVVVLTNASNTFHGGLQLTDGVAAATSDAALGTGPVRFHGGTMRTDYSGTFNRGLTVLTAGSFSTNGNNVSISGAISGDNPAAVLTKVGAGTLTINGTNPYPGTTAVNGGTLALATGASLGSPGSAVIVNNGGTAAGTGTLNGKLTVNPGGTVRGGVAGGTGILSVTGNATLNAATGGGGRISVEVAGPAASATASRLVVGGVLNLAGLAPGIPPPSAPKFVIELISNPADPLVFGQTYSVVIAQTTQLRNIRRNGAQAFGTIINPNDYTLTSSDFGSFTNVQLSVNGTGNSLVLRFTPVPEPATVLGLATATFGLTVFGRRGFSRVTQS